MVGASGVLLERKLLDWRGLGPIRQSGQHTRHSQPEIACIFGLTQRLPGRVSWCAKDLGEVPRIAEFLPGFHVEQGRSSGGQEWRMGCGGNLSEPGKHFHIGGGMVEIEIAHESTVRLSSGHAEFFLVKFLEEWALVPGGAL